jgi:hypothetical protein
MNERSEGIVVQRRVRPDTPRQLAHLRIARLLSFEICDGVSEKVEPVYLAAIRRHLKWAGKTSADLIPKETA